MHAYFNQFKEGGYTAFDIQIAPTAVPAVVGAFRGPWRDDLLRALTERPAA
jgi:hypothetical protein